MALRGSGTVTARVMVGLSLVVLMTLSGCAYRGVQQESVRGQEVYRGTDEFNRDVLVRDGMTFLPAQLNTGQEAFNQMFVQELINALDRDLPDTCSECVGIVHPNRSIDRINEAGLTDEMATMMKRYDLTGILEGDILNRLGEASGARFFLVPILMNYQAKESPRLNTFGFRMIKTTRASANFQLQIWDRRTGSIVWEGTSTVVLAYDTFQEDPVRFGDIVGMGWDKLLAKIPR
jgi:hypothetical protein